MNLLAVATMGGIIALASFSVSAKTVLEIRIDGGAKPPVVKLCHMTKCGAKAGQFVCEAGGTAEATPKKHGNLLTYVSLDDNWGFCLYHNDRVGRYEPGYSHGVIWPIEKY